MSEDKEAQEDELLALASIYDEEEFHRAESAQGGEIQLCLELPPDFKVVVKDYPSTSPPLFTLSCKWMTRAQMSSLCRRLDELWEENQGCVILFTWIQFLKEEALGFLGIQSPLEIIRGGSKAAMVQFGGHPEKAEEKKKELMNSKSEQKISSSSQLDPRTVLLMDPRADLLPQLLDFDEAQRQRVFDSRVFCCGICFVEKLGSNCLCFKECQHVYCKACMTEYFQIQIRDGNVQCLNCPEPKCTSLATPSQVKQLVDEELFARYDRLLLQSSLDLMADVVYCPRQSCATAVMMEPDTTMGICSACQYAFCTLCKLGYHGVSHCKIRAEELRNLRDEYLSATASGQKFMEQRYGKRVIQKAVEESFSRDWLSENCKCCPRCGTNIQKVDGCNKMTCTSCKQYFCWLCLGVLSKVNPYSHFNNPHSPCYNQLFLGVDPDEDDDAFWSDEED
ncbi:E3 ubiquitin-protein ligase RNF14 isoform X2 [Simochromis diagramma]|uniref:E3 ubiquitin-protein ligase RNF14 isoform X2 n=1 Tax=Haplochromis burtoni TaxID=8153 RepID=UPI0003BD0926|nr:E3 ubiquitin-protein ligase RNF14 isoform X2 [Haplochromis burtoni]XP_039888116.1 E3 ubiquitin-protein ligase RNF14 isoform X2 [Simochromis diagramma]